VKNSVCDKVMITRTFWVLVNARCQGDCPSPRPGFACCGTFEIDPGLLCCSPSHQPVLRTPILDLADCPNRVSNPNSPLSPDGCSVPLYGNGPPVLSCPEISFSGACTNHDICYQACNQGASAAQDQAYWHACNVAFKNAMRAICDNSDPTCLVACYASAQVYFQFVDSTLGWNNYVDDQEQACICCPP
jgi:hypothetical protein